MARTPSAEEARPGYCLACGAASHPVGGRVQLWGHGRRERQVRGPLCADGPPQLVGVLARRYQCQLCGAMIVVVPRAVLRYRHFLGAAVAMALALFGVERLSPRGVRHRISPSRVLGGCARGWPTLRRWIEAAREQRLLPGAHRAAGDDRAVAASIAHAVASRAPPPWDAPIPARAFNGMALVQ